MIFHWNKTWQVQENIPEEIFLKAYQILVEVT